MARCHAAAEADETVLRLSLDAKARVAVGLFSRGGRARVVVKALDHDFKPEKKLTPFGIFLPEHDELYLYFTASRVTSDFIADCLDDCWHEVQARFPAVSTLLLNLDNGPENHSRRTQFMKRMTDFADHTGLTVELAYYPPYHSKYNPIERVWGVLEQHWNGSLLESVEAVLGPYDEMEGSASGGEAGGTELSDGGALVAESDGAFGGALGALGALGGAGALVCPHRAPAPSCFWMIIFLQWP